MTQGKIERWVEAGRGDGGLVQGIAHMSASASDVPRAIVFATVAGDRREARDHGGLRGRQGADLVQSGDQRDPPLYIKPWQDVVTGDQAPDSDIVGRYLDGLELAFELQDQPLGLARAEAVENGGPRGDGGIAAIHEFLRGLDEAGRRRGPAHHGRITKQGADMPAECWLRRLRRRGAGAFARFLSAGQSEARATCGRRRTAAPS